MSRQDNLGKLAVARDATGTVYGKGKILAYCNAPQYLIETPSGDLFWWRVDMCQIHDATIRIDGVDWPVVFDDSEAQKEEENEQDSR